MYEELSEDCQHGDSAIKKQVHKRHKTIHRFHRYIFLCNLWMDFVLFCGKMLSNVAPDTARGAAR
jgi:hypothetical protein